MNVAVYVVDDVVSYFVNSGIEGIGQVFTKHKLMIFLEKIQDEIRVSVIERYQTETFYEDFSGFYATNRITKRILDHIFNVIEDESVEKELDILARRFVSEYRQHGPYIARIKEILNKVYQAIYKGIAESGLISEDEQTRLLIAKFSRKEIEKLSEMKETLQEVHKDIRKNTELLEQWNTNPYLWDKGRDCRVLSEAGEVIVENSEYAEKLKRIENEKQKLFYFQEAIDEYKIVLTDLHEMKSSEEILFVEIYINIAMCYANLGKYGEAKKYIQYGNKHIKDIDSAKLHYVSGYIAWKENTNDNSLIVREEMIRALELNKNYVSAKLLLCTVEAQMNSNIEEIISKLKELEKTTGGDRISDVFQTYGQVYRLYGQYEKAEEYVLKAEEIQGDIINIANLGAIYYSWAMQNNEHDKRHLRLKVDYPKMFKALYYLKQVIQCKTREANIYKQEIMGLYISTCMICEAYELIDEVRNFDVKLLDYEAARSLLFHRIRRGEKEAVGLLQQEDKEFQEVVNIVEKDEVNALDIILEKIKVVSATELFRYYNLGLQVSLDLHDFEKYKIFRREVKDKNIECPYLELYDAEYNSVTGQDSKAKEYYDSHISDFEDDVFLIQAMKFYKDRKHKAELKKLYEVSLKKIVNREMTCCNVKGLVGEILAFFIENDLNRAFELFELIDVELIGIEQYNVIKNNLYYHIMDIHKILEANRELQKYDSSIELRINEIILLKCDMQFKEAQVKTCHLLDDHRLSDKQKIVVLELLSELALFNDDLVGSIKFITQAKDLAAELVFEPVHQLYVSRLLRCGDHEGIKYGMEFQKKHPNITDWIRPVYLTKKENDENGVFEGEFADYIKEQNEQFKFKLEFYKNNTISFYQFQYIMQQDMLTVLTYPDCYGTNIVIGTGNNEEIQRKAEELEETIVVDAFTLLFLELYQITNVLDIFNTIYIPYSSVEEIEKLYLQNSGGMIKSVFERIKNDLRFERCPSYAVYDEDMSIYHPKSFFDALELAKKNKTKFLCFDDVATRIFIQSKEHMIGIMPVIQKMRYANGNEVAVKIIYNLIGKNVTFVNFNATDILYALKQTGENAEKKIMSFMNLNRDCDVNSFSRVYLHTIRLLFLANDDKLLMFLKILLQLMDKIYNRARMAKWRFQQYEDDKYLRDYYLYGHFVVITIIGLVKVCKKGELTCKLLCENNYKFIPKIFIDSVIDKFMKNGELTEEKIKELILDIS